MFNTKLTSLFGLYLFATTCHALPASLRTSGNTPPGTWKRTADIIYDVVIRPPLPRRGNFLQYYKGDGSQGSAGLYYGSVDVSKGSEIKQVSADGDAGQDPSTPPSEFEFVPVDSTFMDFSNDQCNPGANSGTCYGHIRAYDSVNQQSTELVVSIDHPGAAASKVPTLQNQYRVDDSGQLFLFWSYDLASSVLEFIGVPNGQQNNATYDYDGPYGAEGFAESNGFVTMAYQTDATGTFIFGSAGASGSPGSPF